MSRDFRRLIDLVEGVNAPDLLLYHWTDKTALTMMMNYNIVVARHEFLLGGDRLSGRVDPTDVWSTSSFGAYRSQKDRRTVKGTSMTRNPWLDLKTTYAVGGDKPFRIGFNQRRLQADHQIIPFRDWYLRKHAPVTRRRDPVTKQIVLPDESEEIVVGDIRPFWHYVDEIAFDRAVLDDSMARYIVGGYLNSTEYAATGLQKNVNKAFVPDHVRVVVLDRAARRAVSVEEFFNTSREVTARETPPKTAFDHDISRGNRSSKDKFWNDPEAYKQQYIQMRNYVDWERERLNKKRR